MKKEYNGNGVKIILDDDMLLFSKMFKKTKIPLAQVTGVFFREADESVVDEIISLRDMGECVVTWGKDKRIQVLVPVHGGNEQFRELYETLVSQIKKNLKPEEFELFLNKTELYNASTKKMAEAKSFTPTKIAGNALQVDEKTKRWRIHSSANIYNFHDIADFELLEDGESIVKGGGIGKTLVGGILFGGTGAVVGAVATKKERKSVCNSMKVKITLKNLQLPVTYINLIETATLKNSSDYRDKAQEAQEILSVLQLMCNEERVEETKSINDPGTQNIEDLRKLKPLLDDGIITQEDFDAKKRQILFGS